MPAHTSARRRVRAVAATAGLLLLLVGTPGPGPAGAGTIGSIRVTKTSDTNDGACTFADCSLREAVDFANINDTNQILLEAGRHKLTRVADGDLAVTGDLTVRGKGAKKSIVDATGIDRVFAVAPGVRLTLIDLAITGGRPSSDGGGAVWSDGGTVRLLRVTVRGNRAGSNPGGGVLGDGGKVIVDDSTLTGNGTGVDGGGIAMIGGTLTIRDSTISGNSAGDQGGGIHVDGTNTNLRHATFARNEASAGGRAIHVASGSATVSDSIVAGGAGKPNCAGTLVSGGHNVDDGWSCGLDAGGDRRGASARLKKLDYYGGLTKTHALRASSPARGRAGACGGKDQRGAPRGKSCDSGAYEYVTCLGRPVNALVPVNPLVSPSHRFTGTRKAEVILGTGQGDTIRGKGGADRMCGLAGNDQLYGDGGDDVMDGGPNFDFCTGGPGRDVAYGCDRSWTVP